jgi:hypothetical protein
MAPHSPTSNSIKNAATRVTALGRPDSGTGFDSSGTWDRLELSAQQTLGSSNNILGSNAKVVVELLEGGRRTKG